MAHALPAKWLFVSLSGVVLAGAIVPAFGQVAKRSLASALGGDFPAYDAVLGKAFKTSPPTEEHPGETRNYRAPYADNIIVTKAKGLKAPGYVSVVFKKGGVKNWKEALAKVGLDGSKAKVASTGDGYVTLSGVAGLKGGFKSVYWIPKSPDTDGKDNLELD